MRLHPLLLLKNNEFGGYFEEKLSNATRSCRKLLRVGEDGNCYRNISNYMNLEDILMGSVALRTEGVVTYAELCAKRRVRREIYQNFINLEDILMDSAALRTEGVVTYAELCAKRRARREIYQNYMNLVDILRKNCRTRPEAVESYCERERSAIVTKIYPN